MPDIADSTPSTGSTNPTVRILRRIGEVLSGIVGYVIFAAASAVPLVITAKYHGGLKTYIFWTPIYAVGSYYIALWLVKVIDKRTEGKPTFAQKWVENRRKENFKRGKKSLMWRLLEAGGYVGFAIACYFLGAIVAVLLLNYSTKIEHLKRVTAIGSVIFAVTFCATYSGLADLVFGR